MTLPIFNQPHAIDFDPTDFWGFKTTPRPELSQRWLSYVARLGFIVGSGFCVLHTVQEY